MQYATRAEDEVFNEQIHPISLEKIDFKKVPTFDVVFDFLNSIYRGERLAPECLGEWCALGCGVERAMTLRAQSCVWRTWSVCWRPLTCAWYGRWRATQTQGECVACVFCA